MFRFWILDFGFWIGKEACKIRNPKAKLHASKSAIANPKSKHPQSLRDSPLQGAMFRQLVLPVSRLLAIVRRLLQRQHWVAGVLAVVLARFAKRSLE